MKYYVWLAQCRLPQRKAVLLLERFGSAKAVYSATERDYLKVAQLEPRQKAVLANKSMERVTDILERCRACGAEILTLDDPYYPVRLRNIIDPPIVLYVRGRMPDFGEIPSIAIVGQREATPYGIMIAEKLSFQLSGSGIIVVSGLAKGIDAAASRGALHGETPTVAVFGTAIDVCYPAENQQIMRMILQKGAILSEYPPGEAGNPGFFPARNRIISGLCLGTVIVEAKKKSGSLITAAHALDQGRDVFAVPGDIHAAASDGTNELIKNGAKLVTDAGDIISEYVGVYKIKAPQIAEERQAHILLSEVYAEAPHKKAQQPKPAKAEKPAATPPPTESQPKAELSPRDAMLLDAIGECAHIDDIALAAGITVTQAMIKLTVLELQGRVCQLPGKCFKRI